MLSAYVDSLLASQFGLRQTSVGQNTLVCRYVDTPAGPVRLFDSAPTGSDQPVVIMVPDGPNVIEHHVALISLLTPHLRVVCFDMPGFGFSYPRSDYTHALDQGAAAILGVLDALGVASATLSFSCANGFYALRTARLNPKRISGLVLVQTPALGAMSAWTKRTVPAIFEVPVIGQILGWLTRKRAANGWYEIALPRNTDVTSFQTTARTALDSGACFCLAGLVQGLSRANHTDVIGIKVPCTMIWGGKDHSHKFTDPQSLLKDVPHAEILHFPDCGHFPDLEQIARFADVLISRSVHQEAGRRNINRV